MEIKNNKLAESKFIYLWVATIINAGGAYIINLYLAAILPPSDYGILAFLISLSVVLQAFIGLGTPAIIIQIDHDTPDKTMMVQKTKIIIYICI